MYDICNRNNAITKVEFIIDDDAITIGEVERKVYTTATIDDDFSDNIVLIVLNRKATFNFKQYIASDFPEIKNVKVEELTRYTAETVKAQIEAEKSQSTNSVERLGIDSSKRINTNDFRRIIQLKLPINCKKNVLDIVKRLEKRSDVLSAEPSFNGSADLVLPNDKHSSLQWAINKIQLPQTWGITTGSPTITVGVVDSGIDAKHIDLVNRINHTIPSVDFTQPNGLLASPLVDQDGHGTKVAGIIGAQGNNEIGITGIAWNLRLVSYKVLDSNGGVSSNGLNSDLVNTIDYAMYYHVPILNISLGIDHYSFALENAIRSYNGLVVASAGNQRRDTDITPRYPGSYILPNLISVGSSKIDDNMWHILPMHSNWGKTTVDLFAPGYNILSTWSSSSGYQYGQQSKVCRNLSVGKY